MCLIAFSYQQHPNFKLIVAANRDEAHRRPTRAAQFWKTDPDILAGQDLKAGGTWMGVHRSGQFSAITNYRNPAIQKDDPPSRGQLVLDFLKNPTPAHHYLQKVDGTADHYMGFNLLAGTANNLYYYSNQQKKIQKLKPGIYGLSNHLLDTPWPKVQRAKKKLEELIKKDSISEQKLFQLLADDVQASDNELPDTGIPKEIEKSVSPVFIKGDEYGTRCSTVLLIDNNNEVRFTERRFKAGSMDIEEENHFTFSIPQHL